VPPRDPEALAGALRELLDHPERRAQYGRAASRRARRHFGFDRIAAATLAVYEDLVAAPARSRSSRRAGVKA
jgi:glycosyltransferase involved in cell wall biosynthesis